MELLMPGKFEDVSTAYGYQRAVFEEVSSGARPPTISITPSIRHVGVTRRDTFRPGFDDAVRFADGLGYPVLVRGAGGGATAADSGTFGFSIIRPAESGGSRNGIQERYDEAASLALGVFERLGVTAEVGEVRDEFCPGDHSLRVGGYEDGMKVVGIAQRLTNRATSVGGIVLVYGEGELARVLEGVYGAMRLPFRSDTVGSLHRAGCGASIEEVIEVFVAEVGTRYGAKPVPLGEGTLESARRGGVQYLVSAGASLLS